MRRLAEKLLDAFRIADAGKLHHDPQFALLRDLRIDHPGRVDSPAHDLDRLLQRRSRPAAQGHLR